MESDNLLMEDKGGVAVLNGSGTAANGNEESSMLDDISSPLLMKMIQAGFLGKKTGRGFYTY